MMCDQDIELGGSSAEHFADMLHAGVAPALDETD